jgi:protein gp37
MIDDARDADALGPVWPWENVCLGATIVNQEEADRDIPKLLEVPARERFLSMEPLLGPVDLESVAWPSIPGQRADVLRGGYWNKAGVRPVCRPRRAARRLHQSQRHAGPNRSGDRGR